MNIDSSENNQRTSEPTELIVPCDSASQNVDNESTNTSSSFSDEDLRLLIPSLESFDSSLLDILPAEIRERARQRVQFLQDQKLKNKSPSVSSLLTVPGASDTVSSNNDEKAESSQDDLIECEQCKKKISAFTLPEHLDWHFAVSLSKQSNNSNITQNSKTTIQPQGKRKRDSSSNLNCDTNKKSCHKDISNFFRKS